MVSIENVIELEKAKLEFGESDLRFPTYHTPPQQHKREPKAIDTRIYDPNMVGLDFELKKSSYGGSVGKIPDYFTSNKIYPVFEFKDGKIITRNDKKEIVTVDDLYFLPENKVEVKGLDANPEGHNSMDEICLQLTNVDLRQAKKNMCGKPNYSGYDKATQKKEMKETKEFVGCYTEMRDYLSLSGIIDPVAIAPEDKAFFKGLEANIKSKFPKLKINFGYYLEINDIQTKLRSDDLITTFTGLKGLIGKEKAMKAVNDIVLKKLTQLF